MGTLENTIKELYGSPKPATPKPNVSVRSKSSPLADTIKEIYGGNAAAPAPVAPTSNESVRRNVFGDGQAPAYIKGDVRGDLQGRPSAIPGEFYGPDENRVSRAMGQPKKSAPYSTPGTSAALPAVTAPQNVFATPRLGPEMPAKPKAAIWAGAESDQTQPISPEDRFKADTGYAAMLRAEQTIKKTVGKDWYRMTPEQQVQTFARYYDQEIAPTRQGMAPDDVAADREKFVQNAPAFFRAPERSAVRDFAAGAWVGVEHGIPVMMAQTGEVGARISPYLAAGMMGAHGGPLPKDAREIQQSLIRNAPEYGREAEQWVRENVTAPLQERQAADPLSRPSREAVTDVHRMRMYQGAQSLGPSAAAMVATLASPGIGSAATFAMFSAAGRQDRLEFLQANRAEIDRQRVAKGEKPVTDNELELWATGSGIAQGASESIGNLIGLGFAGAIGKVGSKGLSAAAGSLPARLLGSTATEVAEEVIPMTGDYFANRELGIEQEGYLRQLGETAETTLYSAGVIGGAGTAVGAGRMVLVARGMDQRAKNVEQEDRELAAALRADAATIRKGIVGQPVPATATAILLRERKAQAAASTGDQEMARAIAQDIGAIRRGQPPQAEAAVRAKRLDNINQTIASPRSTPEQKERAARTKAKLEQEQAAEQQAVAQVQQIARGADAPATTDVTPEQFRAALKGLIAKHGVEKVARNQEAFAEQPGYSEEVFNQVVKESGLSTDTPPGQLTQPPDVPARVVEPEASPAPQMADPAPMVAPEPNAPPAAAPVVEQTPWDDEVPRPSQINQAVLDDPKLAEAVAQYNQNHPQDEPLTTAEAAAMSPESRREFLPDYTEPIDYSQAPDIAAIQKREIAKVEKDLFPEKIEQAIRLIEGGLGGQNFQGMGTDAGFGVIARKVGLTLKQLEAGLSRRYGKGYLAKVRARNARNGLTRETELADASGQGAGSIAEQARASSRDTRFSKVKVDYPGKKQVEKIFDDPTVKKFVETGAFPNMVFWRGGRAINSLIDHLKNILSGRNKHGRAIYIANHPEVAAGYIRKNGGFYALVTNIKNPFNMAVTPTWQEENQFIDKISLALNLTAEQRLVVDDYLAHLTSIGEPINYETIYHAFRSLDSERDIMEGSEIAQGLNDYFQSLGYDALEFDNSNFAGTKSYAIFNPDNLMLVKAESDELYQHLNIRKGEIHDDFQKPIPIRKVDGGVHAANQGGGGTASPENLSPSTRGGMGRSVDDGLGLLGKNLLPSSGREKQDTGGSTGNSAELIPNPKEDSSKLKSPAPGSTIPPSSAFYTSADDSGGERGRRSHDSVVFSKEKGSFPGLKAPALNRNLMPEIRRLAPNVAARLSIVQSVDDLPATVREDVREAQADGGRVEAVYDIGTDKIYAIADNLKDVNRLKQVVVRHEGNHAGVYNVMDKADRRRFFTGIWKGWQSGNKVLAEAGLPGVETFIGDGDVADVADQQLAGEEWFAWMSENYEFQSGPLRSLWDQFVRMVMRGWRRVAPNSPLKEAEIRAWMREVSQWSQQGAENGLGSAGDSRFSIATAGANLDDPADVAEAQRLWAEMGTESPYFKRWFGDSKVVDANGKPLVVYHGTNRSFDAFSEKELGVMTGANSAKEGFFFTDDATTAGQYANWAKNKFNKLVEDNTEEIETRLQDKNDDLYSAFSEDENDANDRRYFKEDWVRSLAKKWAEDELGKFEGGAEQIYPTYLFIKNPLVVMAEDFAAEDNLTDITKRAKLDGHDGVIVRKSYDAPLGGEVIRPDIYIAFSPSQIKSATGNRGTFDAENPDIRMSYDARKAVDGINESGFNIADELANPKLIRTPKAQKALEQAAQHFKWISARALNNMKDGYVPSSAISGGVTVEQVEKWRSENYDIPWHHVIRKGENVVSRDYFIPAKLAASLGQPMFSKQRAEYDDSRRPYANVSDSLMGFSNPEKRSYQKGYDDYKYKKEITVRVSFPPSSFSPEGQSFIDGMNGLNVYHAMERARRNWPDAQIEFIQEGNADNYDASLSQGQPLFSKSPKQRVVSYETASGELKQAIENVEQAPSNALPGQVDMFTGEVVKAPEKPAPKPKEGELFEKDSDDKARAKAAEVEREVQKQLAREKNKRVFDPEYGSELFGKGKPVKGTLFSKVPAGQGVLFPTPGINIPEHRFLGWLSRTFADEFYDLGNAQRAVEKHTGKKLADDADPYTKQMLANAIAAERMEQAKETLLKPLTAAVEATGLPVEEVEQYLHALHAPERNARIAWRNKAYKDTWNKGGSGMSDKDARKIIAKYDANPDLKAKLKKVSDAVQAIVSAERAAYLESGLASPEQVQAWIEGETIQDADLLRDLGMKLPEPYKFYVPLKLTAQERSPETRALLIKLKEENRKATPAEQKILDREDASGKLRDGGRQVRGKLIHKAEGHDTPGSNLLGNLVGQLAVAIHKAEQNKVIESLAQMVEQNPDDRIWQVDKNDATTYTDPTTGEVKRESKRPDDAHLIHFKRNGEPHSVWVADDRIAAPFRGYDPSTGRAALAVIGRVTRKYAQLQTQWAVPFILTNPIRDAQTAFFNLIGTQGFKFAGQAEVQLPLAIQGILRHMAGDKNHAWGKYYDEFRAAGGKMSYMDFRNVEQIAKELESMVAESRGGGWQWTKRNTRKAVGLVSSMNSAMENGIRLATFATARQNGMSAQQAAYIARNVTVDFERKGQLGFAMNALYVFSNANLQGNRRMLAAMKSGKLMTTVAAFAGLAFMLAEMGRVAGGDDDDGVSYWDKIPDWEKERNLIVMLPGKKGKYVKLPMAYGYNVFWSLGNNLNASQHGQTAQQSALNIAAAILGAFNPISNSSASSVRTAVLKNASFWFTDPLVDLDVNESFSGRPIRPARHPKDTRPESEVYGPSMNPMYVKAARAANTASGGNRVRPGFADVSPYDLQYMVNFLIGGAGRFVEQSADVGVSAVRGDLKDKPIRDLPLVNRFAGEPADFRIAKSYYENDQVGKLRIDELEMLAKSDPAAAKKYLDEHRAVFRLYYNPGQLRAIARGQEPARLTPADRKPLAKDTDKKVRAINDQLDAARERQDKSEEKRLLEERNKLMMRFNREFNAATGANVKTPIPGVTAAAEAIVGGNPWNLAN